MERINFLHDERAKYLPPLEKGKGHNMSPIQAFLDGVIDMGEITPKDAEEIFQKIRKSEYHGLLERGRLKKGNLDILFSATLEELKNYDITSVKLTFEKSDNPTIDSAVRNLLREEDGKKNRVIITDDEEAYLVIDTYLTNNYKIRPILIDPFQSDIIKNNRNQWFVQTLQRGFWVISKSIVDS